GFGVPGPPPLLLVAGGAGVSVGMLNPAILPLAYSRSRNGPLAYGIIQIALISGVVAGSLLAGRISVPYTLIAMAGSLWAFGATVALVGASRTTGAAVAAFLLSGAGNAGYSVTNVSAL